MHANRKHHESRDNGSPGEGVDSESSVRMEEVHINEVDHSGRKDKQNTEADEDH